MDGLITTADVRLAIAQAAARTAEERYWAMAVTVAERGGQVDERLLDLLGVTVAGMLADGLLLSRFRRLSSTAPIAWRDAVASGDARRRDAAADLMRQAFDDESALEARGYAVTDAERVRPLPSSPHTAASATSAPSSPRLFP